MNNSTVIFHNFLSSKFCKVFYHVEGSNATCQGVRYHVDYLRPYLQICYLHFLRFAIIIRLLWVADCILAKKFFFIPWWVYNLWLIQ
jgi:hypothetical protein